MRPRELGQNVLGIALMEVRAELMNATSVLIEWRRAHHELLSRPGTKVSLSIVVAFSHCTDYHKMRRSLRTEPLTDIEKMQAKMLQRVIIQAARDPQQAQGPSIGECLLYSALFVSLKVSRMTKVV